MQFQVEYSFGNINTRREQKQGGVRLYTSSKFDISKFNENFEKALEQMSYSGGYFAVLAEDDNKLQMACDAVRNVPLFYSVSGNKIYAGDNAKEIAKKIKAGINKSNLDELKKTGYVTENETVYEKVFLVEAGETVRIRKENGKIERHHYFELKYKLPKEKRTIDFWAEEYDKCLVWIYEKLTDRLMGKTALIPLSGGMDSRTNAVMLKRLGYENVICFSYGQKGNEEAEISKQVAEGLGFPWYFAEYSEGIAREVIDFRIKNTDYFEKTWYGDAVVGIQTDIAIEHLKNKGVLPQDGIIITGDALDFLAGSHIPNIENDEKWTRMHLKDYICFAHYSLDWGGVFCKAVSKWIKKIPKIMDADTVIREYLRWEWNNRQSKYIMNETKQIEWLGFEWEMPFWERELCEFWMLVPLSYLRNRYLQTYHMIHYLNPIAGFVHENLEKNRELKHTKIKRILKSTGVFRWLNKARCDIKALNEERKDDLYGRTSYRQMLCAVKKHGFHYCGIPDIIDAYIQSALYY